MTDAEADSHIMQSDTEADAPTDRRFRRAITNPFGYWPDPSASDEARAQLEALGIPMREQFDLATLIRDEGEIAWRVRAG